MTDVSDASVGTEFSSSELLDNAVNLKTPEKMSTEELAQLKKRMLMKKLALADNINTPRLAKADNYVDFGSKEDEQRELEWLTDRFPPSFPSKSEKVSSISGVVQRKDQKREIMLKLSQQRRKAQERRKELYAQDNEELYGDNEDDEEEEEEEGGEEDEEEEEEEGEEDDIDEEDDELAKEEHCSSEDAMEVEDTEHLDDAEKDNELNESRFEEDCTAEDNEKVEDEHDGGEESITKVLLEMPVSGNCSLALPDSLSQWFNRSEDRLQESPSVDKGMFEEFIELNALAGNERGSKYDLLNLCSGNFPSQNSGEKSTDDDDDDDEEEIMLVRKRKDFLSDDDSGDEEETEEFGNDKNEHGINKRIEEHLDKGFNRVILDSDEEPEVEKWDGEPEEKEEESDGEDDENHQVDSDDEMAVFRRQEKDRRRDWVEEEAQLSGDDVGSDGEEEDEMLNHYETEEGDLDAVPDEEELRVDLHKQLMKQQESSDHRELIQLRERLLGDDMSGSDTNRNRRFRLKLREDEDGIVGEDDEEKKEEEDELDDEANIEVIKRRMEMENEEEVDDEEKKGKETSSIDAFSSINLSTISTNRLGGRVRASLLDMNSSKMLGKENVVVSENKTFFVSKESNDDDKEKECIDSFPIKRKSTAINESTNVKKSKHTTLSSSSLFSKFI